MRSVLCALGLAVLVAGPAAALPESDWKTFLEESYSPHGDKDDPPNWEDHLYRAAKDNKDRDAAVRQFAAAIGLPEDRARGYAETIVAAVGTRDKECKDLDNGCHLAPGLPLRILIETQGLGEPTGELLSAVGETVGTDQPSQNGVFIEIARRHPRWAMILSRLFAYAESPQVLGVMIQETPEDPVVVGSLGRAAIASLSHDTAPGWAEGVLEVGETRLVAANAPAELRAPYAQALIIRELELGLRDDAVRRYLAYPPAVRAALPVRAADCQAGRDCEMRLTNAYDMADQLAAALWLAGHKGDARDLLARSDDRVGKPRLFGQRLRRKALLDAMDPKIADEALFDIYILGAPDDGKAEKGDYSFHGMEGWLAAVDKSYVDEVVARRLEMAGYPAMAARLREPPYRYDRGDKPFDGLLGPEARAAQGRWAARIAAAPRPAAPEESRFLGSPERAFTWREGALPKGAKPWGEKAGKIPDAVSLPVDREAVLRYERNGPEQVVLFQSSEYDLPGEIPAYGVWMVRTVGGRWQAPVYLGLQQRFPYLVTGGSAVPILEGDTVRIEVQVREIDPASIGFPPVGLRISRSADGVVLEASLSELERDGDRDGLADIAERRLGLDPARADSDGDGALDGADPLPLTAYDAKVKPSDRALAVAIFGAVYGHDAGAIMVAPVTEKTKDNPLAGVAGGGPQARRMKTIFLVADPALFASIRPEERLMVYSKDDIARLPTGGAPFFPPRVVNIYSSKDGLRHFVQWSAGWVGGSFYARCPVDGALCEVKVLSSWIT